MMTYTTTQYGLVANSMLLAVMLFTALAYYLNMGDEIPAPAYILIESLLAVILLLFYCLTVEVGAKTISLRFGIGYIRKTIQLDEIEETTRVRNSWWYGFGIRLTPYGWMWNIAGLDAVELKYKGSNKRFRIGTADSERLKAEIDRRLQRLSGR